VFCLRNTLDESVLVHLSLVNKRQFTYLPTYLLAKKRVSSTYPNRELPISTDLTEADSLVSGVAWCAQTQMVPIIHLLRCVRAMLLMLLLLLLRLFSFVRLTTERLSTERTRRLRKESSQMLHSACATTSERHRLRHVLVSRHVAVLTGRNTGLARPSVRPSVCPLRAAHNSKTVALQNRCTPLNTMTFSISINLVFLRRFLRAPVDQLFAKPTNDTQLCASIPSRRRLFKTCSRHQNLAHWRREWPNKCAFVHWTTTWSAASCLEVLLRRLAVVTWRWLLLLLLLQYSLSLPISTQICRRSRFRSETHVTLWYLPHGRA